MMGGGPDSEPMPGDGSLVRSLSIAQRKSNFAFGRGKKNDDAQRDLSNQIFDYMCYDVTKRVQNNKEVTMLIQEQKFEKVDPEQFSLAKAKKEDNIIQRLKQKKIADRHQGMMPKKGVIDPFKIPTTVIDRKVKTSRAGERKRYATNLHMQLRETSEERSLINYQKHLKEWDKYER